MAFACLRLSACLLIPLAGCAGGSRHVPPTTGPTATLVVTSPMNTINQFVRLHDGSCDIRSSSVLGAIRAKAIGFGPYQEEVRTAVAADRRISVAVVGQASEAWRDESGKVIGTRWTTCYPMLSFQAKAGSTYFLEEKTTLNADGASASCVISLRAVDGSGRRETVDDAELKICPVGNL